MVRIGTATVTGILAASVGGCGVTSDAKVSAEAGANARKLATNNPTAPPAALRFINRTRMTPASDPIARVHCGRTLPRLWSSVVRADETGDIPTLVREMGIEHPFHTCDSTVGHSPHPCLAGSRPSCRALNSVLCLFRFIKGVPTVPVIGDQDTIRLSLACNQLQLFTADKRVEGARCAPSTALWCLTN